MTVFKWKCDFKMAQEKKKILKSKKNQFIFNKLKIITVDMVLSPVPGTELLKPRESPECFVYMLMR